MSQSLRMWGCLYIAKGESTGTLTMRASGVWTHSVSVCACAHVLVPVSCQQQVWDIHMADWGSESSCWSTLYTGIWISTNGFHPAQPERTAGWGPLVLCLCEWSECLPVICVASHAYVHIWGVYVCSAHMHLSLAWTWEHGPAADSPYLGWWIPHYIFSPIFIVYIYIHSKPKSLICFNMLFVWHAGERTFISGKEKMSVKHIFVSSVSENHWLSWSHASFLLLFQIHRSVL